TRALARSCLLLTGLLTHVQKLGSSSAFFWPAVPGPKLLSEPLLKRSVKWKVSVEFTGLPEASSTAPPLPPLRGIQSPMSAVGELANKSPSMPNPPLGGLTGAVPPGSVGQFCGSSVNVAEAVAPEAPVAVARRVAPSSSSSSGTIQVV